MKHPLPPPNAPHFETSRRPHLLYATSVGNAVISTSSAVLLIATLRQIKGTSSTIPCLTERDFDIDPAAPLAKAAAADCLAT